MFIVLVSDKENSTCNMFDSHHFGYRDNFKEMLSDPVCSGFTIFGPLFEKY